MSCFLLDCIFTNDKIIIKYPDDLNNKKFVSVIGTLSYDKIFITEYILIYDNKNNQNKHIDMISTGLNKYINGLQLYKNSDSIIDKNQNYKEIGVIVKYDNKNEGNIYYTVNKTKQEFNLLNAKASITKSKVPSNEKFINFPIYYNNSQKDGNKEIIISNKIIDKNLLEIIEKYKIENYLLKKEIEKLKEEKEKEIKYSNKLNEEIIKLKLLEKENYLLMNKIKKLKNEIHEKYLDLEDYKNNNIKLIQILSERKKEIDELNKKLSRYPLELQEGEKLISLIILSADENIRTNIICKNTDNFISIENKLFKEYPQYFKKEYYFTVNGKIIKSYKNLYKNKISNKSIIILNNR